MDRDERARLAEALATSEKLSTVYSMRQELCRREEASGIRLLEEFSLRLRCYA